MSLDVSDAFLTVKQETPTVVSCVDATRRRQEFGLGKVLPGQRDGALLWYRDITGLLKGKLEHGGDGSMPMFASSTWRARHWSCFTLMICLW